MDRILGVDPGIGITGFCILDTNYRRTKLHAYGTIRPKTKDTTPKKLQYLFDEMNINEPIKIYNNYVSFPKIKNFSKLYFNQSKYIFRGKSKSIRLSMQKPLNVEIEEFRPEKRSYGSHDHF